MDDVIYYVNGTYRLLEFLVALCVVAYGVSETVFGEWTVMGSLIIFIHSYYNVWLRAQLGWKSFLLRRDAVNKIKSLPTATKEQLEKHNDICSICYQDMTTAVITPCSHFFHAGCLKKWLYVQETCPLCHCQLKSLSQQAVTETDSLAIHEGDLNTNTPHPQPVDISRAEAESPPAAQEPTEAEHAHTTETLNNGTPVRVQEGQVDENSLSQAEGLSTNKVFKEVSTRDETQLMNLNEKNSPQSPEVFAGI